ncbi:MAG TPA: CHRD domain-containing protein [Acidimicrobiia bacterium]|nr:CHRD domain-containing protein [Acidimicrobiia bacterium]
MRKGLLLGIGMLGVGSWLAMSAAEAAETTVKATMSGSEEVPTPGDPDGKGTVTVVLDDAKNTACYEMTVENIGQPTAAHIHTGAKGVAGPPVIDFKVKTNGNKGCVPADPTTLKAVRDNPAGHYFNVHTGDYGNGAIRGQLAKG